MVARAAVDSPPPPPPPPAYVYAATDERPRTPEEKKLCVKASEPDWLYLGASVVLTAGAICSEGDHQRVPRSGHRTRAVAAIFDG